MAPQQPPLTIWVCILMNGETQRCAFFGALQHGSSIILSSLFFFTKYAFLFFQGEEREPINKQMTQTFSYNTDL